MKKSKGLSNNKSTIWVLWVLLNQLKTIKIQNKM